MVRMVTEEDPEHSARYVVSMGIYEIAWAVRSVAGEEDRMRSQDAISWGRLLRLELEVIKAMGRDRLILPR